MADISGNAGNKLEKLTMEEIADRLEGLKSSLDTIRRTASELIMGIDIQLQELQAERELAGSLEIQARQMQEFILAVSNTERSHFDIVSVKGMEGTVLMDSLLAMTDVDSKNVEAYLAGKGAEAVYLGDERSEKVTALNVGEFHVDYIYNTDTGVITDVKYQQEMDKKANEPVKDSDVILKIMYQDSAEYEIDKITNMTQDQVLGLSYKLAALSENEWDGNIQDFLEENGAESVPIIVSNGRNKGLPEFFDVAVDLKVGAAFLEKDLPGMEYAASITHRLEHGRTVFTPDERNLIVNYGYKLDNYGKTKELAETLAYQIENEPANVPLTIIDAQAEIGELPDSMIGLSEMHEYGYFADEMFPLTKEGALELFERDLPVYLLYGDGSETAAGDREQIAGHDGIFGIEKADWQNEKEYRSMQAELAEGSINKEVQLLYGSSGRYGIYQLKDNPELRDFHFAGTAELLKRGILSDDFKEIQPGNYNLVYVGELSDIQGQSQGEKLNAVFEKFNTDHPADYKGHSLSVSDIVVLHENGGNSAHFVDSFGFTELPDFMRELTGIKEQEADKVENRLTDEEKQFLETDNAPLIAKKFLAWDEMEDLGYRFFEDGYIDKFKPVEKALFGDGLVSDDTIHDIARRMQGGGDIREELAKALIGGCERVTGVGGNDAVAVFGKDAVTVTFENAKRQISYEEMGTAFLSLIENEYKDIEQTRAVGEQEEEITGNAASGHDVKSEAEQSAPEQIQAEKPEVQTEQDELEKSTETSELTDIDDGDEIIDLGDETEQVLADMKKYLEDSGKILGYADQKPKHEPQAQGNVVENFKAKTNELFHEISEMNPAEIEETVKCHVQAQLDESGIDAEIVDVAVTGSRCRGLEREGSDLDVVVELSTSKHEDVLFDTLNGDALHIGEVKVDINPITAQRTGTLETYLPQVEDYLEGVRKARENEPVSIFNIRMNDEERWFKNISGLDAEGLCKAYAECDKPFVEMGKYGERIGAADHAFIEQGNRLDFSIEFNEETGQITIFDGDNFEYKGLRETLFPEQAEPEVTLTVAECGEFHSFGEFHENIATVDEAIAIWKQIPSERMNGIPSIGINIHTPGTETYDDVVTDILTGNRFELNILDYIPEIKNSPQVMEVIAELMAKLPDKKIEGDINEDLEAKIWEKRMPNLTSAEQLAVEIDRFIYGYDTNGYRDSHQNMTENVSEISEMIGQGDVEYLTEWLNEVVATETAPEETQRANELLEKLAEYKPLAKIEEMEEENFNMVDNILNNGAGEKAQKKENKKEQEHLVARTSLKARLSEKKALIFGQGKGCEAQENNKNNQREM